MNLQEARHESERCLQCNDAPCTLACPAHIDVPKFIARLRSGNLRGAAEVVKMSNAMANTCGKVCPQEVFCQSVCTRADLDAPIAIRELHFVATQHEATAGFSSPVLQPGRNQRVAVVGAGPAGLSCAFELSKLGFHVDVYDERRPGGVPGNSIPAFRLEARELHSDVKFLRRYFRIRTLRVDETVLERIRENHDAVFLATGLGRDRRLNIPGENLKGVFTVLEFLERARAKPGSVKVGKNVVVVGGGNVSLDAAATARRLGAQRVVLIYRRGEREMRVWKSELEEARAQGVEIRFLSIPVAILGRSKVRGIRCRRTKLSGRKDSTGRFVPVEVRGSDFVLEADSVVAAIGQRVGAPWADKFKRTAEGYLKTNKNLQTSVAGVFAGGDVISGEGTIVQAVAHGKQAAHAIHRYLQDN